VSSRRCTTTSIAEALQSAHQQLRASTDCYALEARWLLADVLECSDSQLLAHDDQRLTAGQRSRFMDYLQRRSHGEPIAYILGWREFYGLRLAVNESVLIPRPETELLVDQALSLLPPDARDNILDLGTGCGAIALAIANQRLQVNVTATDISSAALSLAQHNAAQLSLSERVEFCHGDWYQALPAHCGKFDLIVSNPPYVAIEDVHLLRGDCRFEPRTALTPGHDDLVSYRHIIAAAGDWLLPDGWLLLEHGHDQRQRLLKLFAHPHWQQTRCLDDLAGIARVIMAQYLPD